MIVDQSSGVRKHLIQALAADQAIGIMAAVTDPFLAAEKIADELPDVILLGVNSLKMDSATFVDKIMSQHPIPILIIAKDKDNGSDQLSQCLRAGAVKAYFCPKDMNAPSTSAQNTKTDLTRMVRMASAVRLDGIAGGPSTTVEPKLTADVILPPPVKWSNFQKTDKVICIGVSTGGPDSLKAVLSLLPNNAPGIVIVQHMPEMFTATFARRMNDHSRSIVTEAKAGDVVQRGRVFIAPGNKHALIRRTGTEYIIDLKDGPPVMRHRPSVDVLFRSAARNAGPNAVGVIMTGMGDDGAQGLLEMRQSGAHTIAESEETCIVYGMPKEAVARGGVVVIAKLNNIVGEIMRLCP